MIIEVEDQAYWDGAWLYSDVLSFLLSFELIPVVRDFQSRFQYNVIFAKNDAFDHAEFRWHYASFLSAVGTRRAVSGTAHDNLGQGSD